MNNADIFNFRNPLFLLICDIHIDLTVQRTVSTRTNQCFDKKLRDPHLPGHQRLTYRIFCEHTSNSYIPSREAVFLALTYGCNQSPMLQKGPSLGLARIAEKALEEEFQVSCCPL